MFEIAVKISVTLLFFVFIAIFLDILALKPPEHPIDNKIRKYGPAITGLLMLFSMLFIIIAIWSY